MNNNQYPQDTSVNPKVSSILGTWQNLQIILGQQVQRYIQSVNTKNQNNRRGVSISDINGLLSFLESTINNTLSVTLNQKIRISKLKTQQNTMNESKNGKKQTIRLNESQLKQIVSESIKTILNELDWKTYANAAKKRLQQYRDNPTDKEKFDKYYELQKHANDVFDDEFVGSYKYDTLGDKFKGKHSPKFDAKFHLNKTDRMPYGAINGYNKGGDKLFSTEKGTYHSSNGITSPGRFFRDKDVADAYTKANDELWDYDNDNYEYIKGKGWVKKGKD